MNVNLKVKSILIEDTKKKTIVLTNVMSGQMDIRQIRERDRKILFQDSKPGERVLIPKVTLTLEMSPGEKGYDSIKEGDYLMVAMQVIPIIAAEDADYTMAMDH